MEQSKIIDTLETYHKPNEEQKEMTSSFQQGILFKHRIISNE